MRRLLLAPKRGLGTLYCSKDKPLGAAWVLVHGCGGPTPFSCFPPACRPKTYHTSLKVAWDLNTGIFVTVSVGDLTEVKGQTR